MEPVGAHCLAEVAGDIDDTAVAVRAARAGIRSVRVDRVGSRQNHRPAIVKELTREEESVGIPIALRRVVPIVFVGRNCVRTKAPVGGDVDGKGVVVPHHQGLAIAGSEQLGGEGAVKSPNGFFGLDGHVGVVLNRDAFSRAISARQAGSVVVQTAGSEFAEACISGGTVAVVTVSVPLIGIAKAGVVTRAILSGNEVFLRGEFIPTLVGPALSHGTAIAGGSCQGVAQVSLNLCLPGVLVDVVCVAGGLRVDRLAHEVVQSLPVGAAIGISIEGGRKGASCRISGLHGLESELLKAQHFHGELRDSKVGARGTSTGNIEATASRE